MTSRKDDKRSVSADKLTPYQQKVEDRVTKEVRAKADQTGEHFGKASPPHKTN